MGLLPNKWEPDFEFANKGQVRRRGIAATTRVYRYMSAARLLGLLSESRLTLVSPRLWHDPFETWWCEQLFTPDSSLRKAHAFGLCWTTSHIDEVFWRLYSCKCDNDHKPPPAVRVKTTVGKLVHALAQAVQLAPAKTFVGRVQYQPEAKLKEFAGRVRSGAASQVATNVANALHMKRWAYRTENEVRVLWVDQGEDRQVHHVPVDPLSLIDQVMIGPTKPDDRDEVACIRALLAQAGIPKDRVKQSMLYHSPRTSTAARPSAGPA